MGVVRKDIHHGHLGIAQGGWLGSWYTCSGGSLRDISGGGLVNGNGGRGGRMCDMRGGGGCLCMYGLGGMCWCCGGGRSRPGCGPNLWCTVRFCGFTLLCAG